MVDGVDTLIVTEGGYTKEREYSRACANEGDTKESVCMEQKRECVRGRPSVLLPYTQLTEYLLQLGPPFQQTWSATTSDNL